MKISLITVMLYSKHLMVDEYPGAMMKTATQKQHLTQPSTGC